MATYARRIDALGGANAEKSADWNEGFSDGLTDAEAIASEADDVIAELVELIDDMLNGYSKLARWADAAEQTVNRIKERTRR